MMPAPTHLCDWLVPGAAGVDGSDLTGRLRCPCGSEEVELFYPGETRFRAGDRYPCALEIEGHRFFLVRARCPACGVERLLFDRDLHGWNGIVRRDAEGAALPRPELVVWRCTRCGATKQVVTIEIRTAGRDSFVEAVEGRLPEERWPDAFGRIRISLRCTECDKITEDWVSCETS